MRELKSLFIFLNVLTAVFTLTSLSYAQQVNDRVLVGEITAIVKALGKVDTQAAGTFREEALKAAKEVNAGNLKVTENIKNPPATKESSEIFLDKRYGESIRNQEHIDSGNNNSVSDIVSGGGNVNDDASGGDTAIILP